MSLGYFLCPIRQESAKSQDLGSILGSWKPTSPSPPWSTAPSYWPSFAFNGKQPDAVERVFGLGCL